MRANGKVSVNVAAPEIKYQEYAAKSARTGGLGTGFIMGLPASEKYGKIRKTSVTRAPLLTFLFVQRTGQARQGT